MDDQPFPLKHQHEKFSQAVPAPALDFPNNEPYQVLALLPLRSFRSFGILLVRSFFTTLRKLDPYSSSCDAHICARTLFRTEANTMTRDTDNGLTPVTYYDTRWEVLR
eukprot:6401340-Pyramimonas_sp.AAC.1